MEAAGAAHHTTSRSFAPRPARRWGPHFALVYLGARAYSHVPALAAARSDLASLGAAVFAAQWGDYGIVGENYNAYVGYVTDSGDADPFYAWGAMFGLPALLEAGF